MGQTVNLTATDGFETSAYIAEPDGAPKGGVVILQEIFGLTPHILRVVDQYASQGYRAVAPALFDRAQKDCVLSYDDVDQARSVMASLKPAEAMTDVSAAIDAARCEGGVAVIGFCWGGTLSYLAACDLRVDAGVAYYGTRIAEKLDKVPECPFLFHFGEDDHLVPPEDVKRIREANPGGIVHVYDAGHGFNCDARASFHAPSAEAALARTLAFLETILT